MKSKSATAIIQKTRKVWAEETKSSMKRQADEITIFWEALIESFKLDIEALEDNLPYPIHIRMERSKGEFKLDFWGYSLEFLLVDFSGDIFYRFLSPRLTAFQGKENEILSQGQIHPSFYGTRFEPELLFVDHEAEYENQRMRKFSSLTHEELESESMASRVARYLLDRLLSGPRSISRIGD